MKNNEKDTENFDINTTPVSEEEDLEENSSKERKAQKNDKLIYCISAIVALPTAILNGLSALQGQAGLPDAQTPELLYNTFLDASTLNQCLSTITFIASESVLLYLNKKHLLDACKSSLGLVTTNINYLHSKSLGRNNQNINYKKPSYLENLLFVWSLMTSLIFAEIGGEILAFLGTAGVLSGFILNLLVHFATRFNSAQVFFKKFIDSTDSNTQDKSIEKEISPIFNQYCHYAMTTLGYVLAAATAFPVSISFIPVSIEGLQRFTHYTFWAHPNYQDPFSIMLGTILILPTVFFYAVHIKELPEHLLKTGILLKEQLDNRHFRPALIGLFLTIVAFAASYFTGIGFRLVAYTNISKGYTDYLGHQIESYMPAALFAAILMMFWAPLQKLIHESDILKSQDPQSQSLTHRQSILDTQDLLEDQATSKNNTSKWLNFFCSYKENDSSTSLLKKASTINPLNWFSRKKKEEEDHFSLELQNQMKH